ncbi:unnamed protein product [Gongylonema pulchrum]|uniref:AF-4_C domain-containing protein n=1 Tax=Gongylonema pulchrum TaxID=637853 RepID=A0A183DP04_9BILA|nr:unnamed protein product [Gongylonema pulchrum]
MLSWRVQAVLNYCLYTLKDSTCITIFGKLMRHESQFVSLDEKLNRNEAGAQNASKTIAGTPSPASSSNSGRGERQASPLISVLLFLPLNHMNVPVPADLYQAQRTQLSILHHLMWSDRLWQQTSGAMTSIDREMEKHLEELCGPLTVNASLIDLAEYLATAVTWLQAEYQAEKGQFPSTSV